MLLDTINRYFGVLVFNICDCAYSTASPHLKLLLKFLITVLFQQHYHLFSESVELEEGHQFDLVCAKEEILFFWYQVKAY